MRVIFAIMVCKALKAVGKLLKRGSSLPGQIALKLYPNILKKIKMPQYVVAITGSNGKTTTVEMTAHALQAAGKNLIYNKEGSNQIEGVATLILSNCTFFGRVKADILLLESDERYAKHTFKYFTPTHYCITNLCRDQLTRNGHPEWVFDDIKRSIRPGTTLVLNADDPLVSLFAHNEDAPKNEEQPQKTGKNVWFGINRTNTSQEEVTAMYNDFYFCPKCNAKMDFDYVHYSTMGAFSCPKCGYKKHATDYTVTQVDEPADEITIDGQFKIKLAQKGMHNIYNLLAAFALCGQLGLNPQTTADALSGYTLTNGRTLRFALGGRKGVLLTSKHENSVSYDQSLKIAANSGEQCDVLIIVDAISRKYFTGETSWLWDINFNLLNNPNIGEIYLCGTYCSDLALRFEYTDIAQSKIHAYSNIAEGVGKLKSSSKKLFVITCFSDKDKFLVLTD
ncbi:MAG: MurT ligase domain-containing protein [Oscillospiraceae bacterium]|jgi:UDP-N-acetylmuramyl tripeptide synthase|nr:MurT ligase domain-containing protein [Oscillospiraceae bacterium]